ncbi:MAG TPA: glycosyl hydrolase [Candidatus Eisenbacteria bacterium]|nr:glycosyl hydrolase [Candidatus Eisenbacteria bacterium]
MLPFPRGRALAGALAAALLFAATAATAADDWKLDSDTFEGLKARSLGPGVMSGRISCIDGVSGDRDVLWVGTAGGGVWVSRDAGTTWKPVFDRETPSIGAIRVSPKDPNTVWVGTGESWTRNSVGVGDGVYRTTDGGDNWTRMGLERTERIARIVVRPDHPDTVLVAALGPLFGGSPERGVYRTRDGGKTWDKVLFVNDDTGAADLALDPQNPDVVYAAMWQVRRRPWTFSSGGPGSGLWKSTDGGATWRRLTNGLPAGDLGRIGLAVSPARTSRVYAAVEAKKTGFYRSDDCGEHWTWTNDSNANVTWRPFYFANVVADPKDFERVYKGALTLSVSHDGGGTWAGVGQGSGFGGASYHSDVHALWVDPRNTEFLVMGTDGGVYVSLDRGNTWRAVQNLPVGQFYHVTYDMQWPYNVYGGLQDNGTWMGPSRHSGGIPNRLWKSVDGGDGMWAFPDPKDGNLVYAEYQGGHSARVNVTTGETKDIQPLRGPSDPTLRFNWNAPLVVGPSGALYSGAQFLYRSRDRGDSWERLSPDLTTHDPAKLQQSKSGGLSVDVSAAENHCTIYAVGESPKDANVIWVGTDDGNVQLTRDGGKTWANVTRNLPGLPACTWISSVCASPFDAGTCFLTADGHMLADMRPHVYVTRDYGQTWTPLGGDAIRGYCHVVKQDLVNPDLVFVGSEWGLWCSLDGGKQWAQIHAGIPNVPVRDLAIQPREGDLLVATHGRGIYVVDDLSPLRALTPAALASDAAFLDARPSVLVIPSGEQRFDGDTEYSGDDLAETAVITYYLKKRHLIGDLKLQVFDPAGTLLTTINGIGRRRGINRVEWPMRLKGPKIPPAANLVPNFFAFVGPRAAAGDYTVKLTRNTDTYAAKIRLAPDPRSTHTTEDRAAQVALVHRLYDMLGDLSYTVEGAAALRDSARSAARALGRGKGAKLTAFADKLEALRGSLVATREGGQLSGDEKLREQLGDLYGNVNGYDGRPTQSQSQLADVLEAELRKAQASLDGMVAKDLPALNAELRGAKLAELKRATRAEWEKATEAGGRAGSLWLGMRLFGSAAAGD